MDMLCIYIPGRETTKSWIYAALAAFSICYLKADGRRLEDIEDIECRIELGWYIYIYDILSILPSK